MMQEIGHHNSHHRYGTSNGLAVLSDIKEGSSDSDLSDSADSCSLSHQLLKHECTRSTTSQILVSLHIFHIFLTSYLIKIPKAGGREAASR